MLIAPWLLGGRTASAPWLLGALLWLAVFFAVVGLVRACREWALFADYEMRRGNPKQNPWPILRRGILRSAPLMLLAIFLILGACNPAYERMGDSLTLRTFHTWLPIVVDPARSRPGIFFLTSILVMLGVFASPLVPVREALIRRILALSLINACLLTAMGIYFNFAGNGLILGLFPPRAHYFFASFYYKNHWAAYALLHCGFAAFFFLRDLPRWQDSPRQAGTGGLALVSLLFLGLSFPIVDSRSGILLFACLLFLLGLAMFKQAHNRTLRLTLVGLIIGTIGLATSLTLPDLRRNWERTDAQMQQAGNWIFDDIRATHGPEVCSRMIAERPLSGWGYLSFHPAFPAFATDFFRNEKGQLLQRMEFAHNDWLQFTAELGLVGMGLLLAGLIPLFQRPTTCDLTPWIRAGSLLLALLATWDFPFSNPSVLLVAALSLLLALRSQH